MNHDLNEPAKKKFKLDTKCCFFRKGTINKVKTLKSKLEVQDFFLKYGYLAQVAESICNYCYEKLRIELSKRNKVVVQNQSIQSSSKENDPSTSALTKNLSKSSLDEKESSNIPES